MRRATVDYNRGPAMLHLMSATDNVALPRGLVRAAYGLRLQSCRGFRSTLVKLEGYYEAWVAWAKMEGRAATCDCENQNCNWGPKRRVEDMVSKLMDLEKENQLIDAWFVSSGQETGGT